MRIRWNCLLTALLLAPLAALHAADLHVDARRGDDGNPGTLAQPNVEKTDGPKATLSAASGLLQPGDVCLIHAGTYRETLRPARSGTADEPIIYKAAGDGTVIITGADRVTGWRAQGNKIFKAAVGTMPSKVFVDGHLMIPARFPNASYKNGFDWFHLPEAPISAPPTPNSAKVTVRMPSATGGYAGATLVAKISPRWGVDMGVVNSMAGGNLEVFKMNRWRDNALDDGHYIVPNMKPGMKGARYWWFHDIWDFGDNQGTGFLIGALALLDSPGEWFHQDGFLYLMTPAADDPSGHTVDIGLRARAIAPYWAIWHN